MMNSFQIDYSDLFRRVELKKNAGEASCEDKETHFLSRITLLPKYLYQFSWKAPKMFISVFSEKSHQIDDSAVICFKE